MIKKNLYGFYTCNIGQKIKIIVNSYKTSFVKKALLNLKLTITATNDLGCVYRQTDTDDIHKV